jgi:polysaccharide export outer membrane protein
VIRLFRWSLLLLGATCVSLSHAEFSGEPAMGQGAFSASAGLPRSTGGSEEGARLPLSPMPSSERSSVVRTPSIVNSPLPYERNLPVSQKRDSIASPEKGIRRSRNNPDELNEFQTFLLHNTGQKLPMFGAELFLDQPQTFAPADQVPPTSDYVVGVGDELLIRAWGQVDIDYTATVDRNGNVYLPKVGSIHVAGLRFAELSGYVKAAVGRVFHDFELNVNLSQLRSIQVLVVGQAKFPGNYTVSALSTLVNGLFAAGGPASKGSMRRIQLKRDKQVVSEFDLYALLLRGDKGRDVALQNGDVIFIPPLGKMAAIHGSVNSPAVYELREGETLASLLEMAGGLSTTAEGRKVTVERISDRSARSVSEFALDAAGLSKPVQDGDVVRVYEIVPRFDNAITLRGNVATPARFPWREGMRVKDVIPSREMLIPRNYWLSRTALVQPGSGHSEKIVSADGTGRLYADIKRNALEVNWDYAVIERMSTVDLTTSLIPFNLGRAIQQGDPEQNLALMAGDVITVFSKDDIQVPLARQSQYVRLEGEISGAGVYKIEPGESLRQLVARCGGLTPNAYLFGAEFTRESTRLSQQKKLDEFTNKMERDLERAATSKAQSAISPEDAASLKAQQDSQRALVSRLRQVKSTGRVVLEIPGDISLPSSTKYLPDLALEDGDRLFIPSVPSTINVIGSVYNETAFIYKPGKDVGDYMDQSGGTTVDADNASLYVARADGSVLSKRQSGWLGGFGRATLMPGDTLVVPEKTDKVSWIKELKDWSQIFYQFGLGASALKVLMD